jgi:hypothetical protein
MIFGMRLKRRMTLRYWNPHSQPHISTNIEQARLSNQYSAKIARIVL